MDSLHIEIEYFGSRSASDIVPGVEFNYDDTMYVVFTKVNKDGSCSIMRDFGRATNPIGVIRSKPAEEES